jgi:hypothetical protein
LALVSLGGAVYTIRQLSGGTCACSTGVRRGYFSIEKWKNIAIDIKKFIKNMKYS